jgi:Flp pilus assembly protein CpaB
MTPATTTPPITSPIGIPVATSPGPGPRADEREPHNRSLGRRTSLPGGRAVVGGLLVTLAAVGTFFAYALVTAAPKQTYLVARRDVAGGQRLSAGDVVAVAADVPPDIADRLFSSPSDIEGAVALSAIAANEFVGRGAIKQANSPGGAGAATGADSPREYSFSIERDRALDGRIQRGELIDILATFTSGGSNTYTDYVGRRVPVLGVESTGGSVSGGGTVTITIGLKDEMQVIATAHAVAVATVSLARSTQVDPANPGPSVNRYAPDPTTPPGTAPGGPTGAPSTSLPTSSSTSPTSSTSSTNPTPARR